MAFVAMIHEVTAFDASEGMTRLASRHLGLRMLRLPFDQAGFEGGFDGVWARASLLHVLHRDMPGVLRGFAHALEPGGILYASFRYGEAVRGGRLFSDYREGTFRDMLLATPELRPVELWRPVDARTERTDTVRLNALLRKRVSQPGTSSSSIQGKSRRER